MRDWQGRRGRRGWTVREAPPVPCPAAAAGTARQRPGAPPPQRTAAAVHSRPSVPASPARPWPAAAHPPTHPPTRPQPATHLDLALLGVAALQLRGNGRQLAVKDGHRLRGEGHRPAVQRVVKVVQLAAVDVEGDLAARARLFRCRGRVGGAESGRAAAGGRWAGVEEATRSVQGLRSARTPARCARAPPAAGACTWAPPRPPPGSCAQRR